MEGLSPVLYHSTDMNKLIDILKSNEFHLVPDIGTKSDAEHRQADKIYYMSTARTKTGKYHYPAGKYSRGNVLIELDGRKLGADYSGKAVDYWQDNPERSEQEDRIFSKQPKIPNASKYITSIHMLYMTDGDSRAANNISTLRKIAIAAKQLGINLFVYDDPKKYNMLDTRHTINISDLTTDKEKDNHQWFRMSRNYFAPYTELLMTPLENYESLSDKAKSRLRNIMFDHMKEANSILKADIHNARSMNRDQLDKFIQVMKKLGLRESQDVIDYIQEKYSEIFYT